ncbi:unnamed protein product, partial [Onchocerca ochengi]
NLAARTPVSMASNSSLGILIPLIGAILDLAKSNAVSFPLTFWFRMYIAAEYATFEASVNT